VDADELSATARVRQVTIAAWQRLAEGFVAMTRMSSDINVQ